ncbi:MAG: sulfatase-like hydrolase/transferase [Alphaproteobacteria bacterium]
MGKVRNILFIMCDQLRADCLSCYGHPRLETPNIDRLAVMGVRFSNAYVQSPTCLPSRMSYYTGRYVVSHGATWNMVPMGVGQWTLGDHLRPLGLRVALAGKTHMFPDLAGMRRLGVDPGSGPGELARECGFEPYERDDGLHPDPVLDPDLPYNRYLKSRGYEGKNPWHDHANAGEGPGGEIASGWYMRNARLPARVREEDSETAYMTDRAIAFVEEMGDRPWLLHLSYIKPHWPYIAPAPYHAMFGPEDCLPVLRAADELDDPHPVFAASMNHEWSRNFRRDEVRDTVLPTYMGLVKQIDDHLGRLFKVLEDRGRMDDTMIVFSSDHGDYLGDHWLGDKEMFHEVAIQTPLVVYDPDPDADGTRGQVDRRLVEAIDLTPTFIEALGGSVADHVLEGRSLMPLLRGQQVVWRDGVFSELDYAFRPARHELGRGPDECFAFMVRTESWKYIHFEGYRPMLFDLVNDPDEFMDLGADPSYARARGEMRDRLFEWFSRRKCRTAITNPEVERLTDSDRQFGVIIGVW